MIARSYLLAATLVAGLIALTAASLAQDSEYGVLHQAPGVEETYIYCAACHSERLVAQQGLSRGDWESLFDWMVEEQGMDEIEEPDRSIVLDYLTMHYNIDRPYFPGR